MPSRTTTSPPAPLARSSRKKTSTNNPRSPLNACANRKPWSRANSAWLNRCLPAPRARSKFPPLSKAEILAELPNLKGEELAEIQARIEELAVYGPDGWLVDNELTNAEKRLIEERLDDAEKHPEHSIPWAEAEARLKARFGE